jgi:hypothetical protein
LQNPHDSIFVHAQKPPNLSHAATRPRQVNDLQNRALILVTIVHGIVHLNRLSTIPLLIRNHDGFVTLNMRPQDGSQNRSAPFIDLRFKISVTVFVGGELATTKKA